MAITLNTKTYNFAGLLQAISNYRETSGGVANAFSYLTSRVSQATNRYTVTWKLKVPVVAAADSSCACVGEMLDESIVDIVVKVGSKRSTAERTDLALRIKDLVASTEFQSSISNLVQPTA